MNQPPVLANYNKRIQESFINPEKEEETLVGKIKNQLKENLTKGLIDEDTFKKAEEQLDNLVKAKKGEGSKGGKVIGHTKSGKPVYATMIGSKEIRDKYTPEDHKDASDFHIREAQKHQQESYGRPDKYGRDFHSALAEHHRDLAKHHEDESVKLAKKELHPDEKKILADQKKKQIREHEEKSKYHEKAAKFHNSIAEGNPYIKEHANQHQKLAEYHHEQAHNLSQGVSSYGKD